MRFAGLTNDALALVEYALNLVARGCTLDLSGEVAHGGHRRRRLLRFLQYLAVRIGSTAECTWYTTGPFPWKVAVVRNAHFPPGGREISNLCQCWCRDELDDLAADVDMICCGVDNEVRSGP